MLRFPKLDGAGWVNERFAREFIILLSPPTFLLQFPTTNVDHKCEQQACAIMA